MPVRNKKSKHQRRPKPLGISSKEIQANNERNRAVREQKEAEEQERLEKRLEHERQLKAPTKKPRKVFDLKTPSHVRPIFGLPEEVTQYFNHKFSGSIEFSETGLVIAIFAGEPKKANASGPLGQPNIREGHVSGLYLNGRLPKNLVSDFGQSATKANPAQCRLLNSPSVLDIDTKNPRDVNIGLGIKLGFVGVGSVFPHSIHELNEILSDAPEITVGEAFSLDGNAIGEPRQKRQEDEDGRPIGSVFGYR